MAKIVKPKLQNHGNITPKTYEFNAKNTKINYYLPDDAKQNNKSGSNSTYNYEKNLVNPNFVDVFSESEGPLQSLFDQYHIFDDVSDTVEEQKPTPLNPAEEKPTEEVKPQEETKPTEEKPKEEKKEDKKEEKQEEPKKEEKKTNDSSKPYGELDMTDYPKNVYDKNGNYDQAAAKARAVLVAKYLVNEGGFTKEQAAAMVGVYWDENQCNPGDVMQAEYKANKNSYGAGIGSWTDQSYKNQCLKDAGLPANTPIESLTLEQQCDMIIAMSNGSDKRYYDALKRCDNIEDASATAVCITGGVGFSNHWSTHPTPEEARKLANWYAERNDKKYEPSSYHHNLDQRRLQRAKEVYAEL